MSQNGLIGGAAVLLVANGIIEDGKADAGSVKDCGVGQGCALPGWGFLRVVGSQLSGGSVCPAG
jgi:hypothetical protein